MTSTNRSVPGCRDDGDRTDNIEKAWSAIEAGMAGQRLNDRLLAYTGDRGVGLSWLLLHIHEMAKTSERQGSQEFVIDNFFVSFDSRLDLSNSDGDAEFVVPENGRLIDMGEELLKKICTRVDAVQAEDATINELSEWMLRAIRKRAEQYKDNYVFVLTLDAIFEAQRAHFEQVETYLLKPLLPLSNVVFIMSGRGEIPAWTSPELRRIEKEIHKVEPFGLKATEQQLRRLLTDVHDQPVPLRDELVATVSRLSAGYPLNNYLLLRELSEMHLAHKRPDTTQFSYKAILDALNVTAHALLEPFEAQLRHFEALCLLDGFREWEVSQFFVEYFHEPRYADDGRLVMQQFSDMLQTRLISWSTEDNRYKMNESIRVILDHALWYRSELGKQEPTWAEMHRSAQSFYEDFARNPDSSAYYQKRAEYHKQCLKQATIDRW